MTSKALADMKSREDRDNLGPAHPNGRGVLPRPRGFALALIAARSRAGLTQSEVARRASCERSYISMLESGQRDEPSKEMLRALERALGMSEGELRREAMRLELGGAGGASGVGGAGAGERAESALDAAWRSGELARLVARLSSGVLGGNIEQTRGMLMRQVPLINNVAAGTPTEFTDLGYPARVADEYVAAPMVDDPDAFAARVVGDSMEPNYRAGDIVIFSPARIVQSGMDCFVRLEPDQETTFKRVKLMGSEEGPEGGEAERREAVEVDWQRVTHIRLEALNPKYPARVVEREMVAGMYAAVSVVRMV